MSLSARLLGKRFGLTAQEMNRVLVKRGILQGTPGNYTLTELGKKYACVRDFHRGCGGYDFYNRYWETISYDESILDILNITDEVRKEAIAEIMDYRALQRAQRELEFAKDEAEQLAKAQKIIDDQIKRNHNLKIAGVSAAVIIGLAVTGVVVYKVVPKIKARIAKSKAEKAQGAESSGEETLSDNIDDKNK